MFAASFAEPPASHASKGTPSSAHRFAPVERDEVRNHEVLHRPPVPRRQLCGGLPSPEAGAPVVADGVGVRRCSRTRDSPKQLWQVGNRREERWVTGDSGRGSFKAVAEEPNLEHHRLRRPVRSAEVILMLHRRSRGEGAVGLSRDGWEGGALDCRSDGGLRS